MQKNSESENFSPQTDRIEKNDLKPLELGSQEEIVQRTKKVDDHIESWKDEIEKFQGSLNGENKYRGVSRGAEKPVKPSVQGNDAHVEEKEERKIEPSEQEEDKNKLPKIKSIKAEDETTKKDNNDSQDKSETENKSETSKPVKNDVQVMAAGKNKDSAPQNQDNRGMNSSKDSIKSSDRDDDGKETRIDDTQANSETGKIEDRANTFDSERNTSQRTSKTSNAVEILKHKDKDTPTNNQSLTEDSKETHLTNDLPRQENQNENKVSSNLLKGNETAKQYTLGTLEDTKSNNILDTKATKQSPFKRKISNATDDKNSTEPSNSLSNTTAPANLASFLNESLSEIHSEIKNLYALLNKNPTIQSQLENQIHRNHRKHRHHHKRIHHHEFSSRVSTFNGMPPSNLCSRRGDCPSNHTQDVAAKQKLNNLLGGEATESNISLKLNKSRIHFNASNAKANNETLKNMYKKIDTTYALLKIPEKYDSFTIHLEPRNQTDNTTDIVISEVKNKTNVQKNEPTKVEISNVNQTSVNNTPAMSSDEADGNNNEGNKDNYNNQNDDDDEDEGQDGEDEDDENEEHPLHSRGKNVHANRERNEENESDDTDEGNNGNIVDLEKSVEKGIEDELNSGTNLAKSSKGEAELHEIPEYKQPHGGAFKEDAEEDSENEGNNFDYHGSNGYEDGKTNLVNRLKTSLMSYLKSPNQYNYDHNEEVNTIENPGRMFEGPHHQHYDCNTPMIGGPSNVQCLAGYAVQSEPYKIHLTEKNVTTPDNYIVPQFYKQDIQQDSSDGDFSSRDNDFQPPSPMDSSEDAPTDSKDVANRAAGLYLMLNSAVNEGEQVLAGFPGQSSGHKLNYSLPDHSTSNDNIERDK